MDTSQICFHGTTTGTPLDLSSLEGGGQVWSMWKFPGQGSKGWTPDHSTEQIQQWQYWIPNPLSHQESPVCLFFNNFIRVYFTHVKIPLFPIYNSVVFREFTKLFNHKHESVLEHFHHSSCLFTINSIPTSSPRQLLIYIVSLSIDWPFLDISCKCDHKMCSVVSDFFNLPY